MKIITKISAFILLAAMVFTMSACTVPKDLLPGGTGTGTLDNYHTKDQVNELLTELRTALTAMIDDNGAAIIQLGLDYDEKLAELTAADKANADEIAALTAAYEAKVAELSAEIAANEAALKAASDVFNKKAADLAAEDDANEAAILALAASYEAKVTEFEAAISEVEAKLAAQKSDYDAKLAALEAQDAKLSADITAATEAYEAEIAKIKADVKANTDAVAALRTEYEAKAKELADNGNATADALLALKEAYDAKIAALEAKVAALEKEEGGVSVDYSAKIAELVAADSANTAAINALRTEFETSSASLTASLESYNAKLEAAKTDYTSKVNALDAKITENAASVAELRTEYEAKALELEARIDSLNKDHGVAGTDYSAQIAALEAKADENAAAIIALKADYDAKFEELSSNASELLGIDATLTEAGKAADSKAVGDAIAALSESLTKVTDILTPRPTYGYVYTDIDITSEEAIAKRGFYMAPSGSVSASSSYTYSQKIDVLPGDVVHIMSYNDKSPSSSTNYSKLYSMRMAAVYNSAGKAVSSLGFSEGSGLTSYTIPEGGVAIQVTYTMSYFTNGVRPILARYTPVGETYVIADSANSDTVLEAVENIAAMKIDIANLKTDVESLDAAQIQKLSDNIVTLNAKIDALDVDKLNDAISSIKNLDTNGLNILTSATLGSPSISASAKKLSSGESIKLENNTMINNKNLTFTCDIGEGGLGDGRIRLGHGKTEYGASYIEVTATKLFVYSVASSVTEYTFDHGLEIKDYLSISIDADYHWATFNIATATGYYTVGKNWSGRNGAIFAEPVGVEITNVGMRWYCEDYQHPIWMVGDSYFNSKSGDRWTSYLISAGYTNILMMSFPGMGTERGLTEVKQALLHGTPQYIVWCMGMNNGDNVSTGAINAGYLAATEEFLEICKEKGITPILTTIPSTPIVYNEPKNAYVREWAETTGGRYIDFSRAVCNETYDASLIGTPPTNTEGVSDRVNKTGYQWYDGMLYKDAVHPATLGAKALFLQALVDFPELMRETAPNK